MIVEMRTMRVKPGRRADFLEIFQTRSMPAQAALGIKMLRPFLSVEDPDVFFFVRGFPDMASRDTMKEQFYEGPVWKGELEALLLPLLDSYDVVVIDDPDGQIKW